MKWQHPLLKLDKLTMLYQRWAGLLNGDAEHEMDIAETLRCTTYNSVE